MNNYLFLFFLFTAVLRFPICNSQQLEGIDINKSDLLINGKRYFKEYPNANGNSYFGTDKWSETWISIQSILFSDVEIKLDIVSDKLIFKLNMGESIELNPQLVDSFFINSSLFVTNKDLSLKKNYLEKIHMGNFFYYKTHQKEFIKEYNSFSPFGKISDIQTTRFIAKNGSYTKVNSKGEFLNLFKSNKKDIKIFLKKNNINYRRATNDELKKLMVFCENL